MGRYPGIKYNPHQFRIARHLTGLSKWQYARKCGLTTQHYSDIELGEIEPSESEVSQIVKGNGHVLAGFFEHWPDSEIDLSRHFYGSHKPINYFKYKVFRAKNPLPLRIA
jgi:transcriptional regulator with XRE-family HTH domain